MYRKKNIEYIWFRTIQFQASTGGLGKRGNAIILKCFLKRKLEVLSQNTVKYIEIRKCHGKQCKLFLLVNSRNLTNNDTSVGSTFD